MNMHPKGPPRKGPKPIPPRRAESFPVIAKPDPEPEPEPEPVEYNPKEASRLLRELRERYGVMVSELSRWSGVGAPMISRIERGDRSIQRDTLEHLLTALDPTRDEANLIRLSAGFAPK